VQVFVKKFAQTVDVRLRRPWAFRRDVTFRATKRLLPARCHQSDVCQFRHAIGENNVRPVFLMSRWVKPCVCNASRGFGNEMPSLIDSSAVKRLCRARSLSMCALIVRDVVLRPRRGRPPCSML